MATKKQEQGLVLASTSVPDAIAVINEKIKALKHIQDSVYVTSGSITMHGGNCNVKDETSITKLVQAYSSVLYRARAIDEAQAELGITSMPLTKVDGHTVEEWKQDIKLRLDILNQKETLDKLQGYKKQWEELMDKEDRKAILMKEMAEFVGA